jgi:porin
MRTVIVIATASFMRIRTSIVSETGANFGSMLGDQDVTTESTALRLMARAGILAAAIGFGTMPAGAADLAAKEPASAPKSLWEQETLTGDWGGTRSALKDKGLDFALNYIGEGLYNTTGGLRRGGVYQGRLEFSIDADLEKLFGWTGGAAHVTAFQIHNAHGRIGPDYVGSISDPSNIDALATTRPFTAWLEQSFFDGKASIRIGQLAADDEFLTSETAGGLINGTFGWANIAAANLPSGGPAYPLATPGVRLKVKASDQLTVLAAIFSGDPAGPNCTNDPQICNRWGTKFSFWGGTFSMLELQYGVNQEKDAVGMPGVYKLGGWYHSGNFLDQRYGVDAAGLPVSLASPLVVDTLSHRGSWGVYGVADQMVWRAANGPQSVNIFVRAGGSPDDRSLLSFYVDGGVGIKAPLPGRDDDVFTFGVSYSNISRSAVDLDYDTLAFSGPPYPIRNYELVLEASYQFQVAPWWIIQPDVQYIAHPGGNAPDLSGTTAAKDAFVIGARSVVKF